MIAEQLSIYYMSLIKIDKGKTLDVSGIKSINTRHRFGGGFKKTALYKSCQEEILKINIDDSFLIKNIYGGNKYDVENCADKGDTKKMSLKAYFGYCNQKGTSCKYYLKDLYVSRSSFNRIFQKKAIHRLTRNFLTLPHHTWTSKLRWFYIGKAFTYSALHYDVISTSAWNYLFYGKKLWLFLDSGKRLNHNRLSVLTNELLQTGKLPSKKFRYCIQESGDLVFVPSGVAHMVINLTNSLSFTENIVNQDNFVLVKNDLLRLHMIKELNTIEIIKSKTN